MVRFIGVTLFGLMIGCGEYSPPPKVADDTSSQVEADAAAGKRKLGEGWFEDGDRVPDSPNMKSKDGFGAQLFLIENEQFFDDWNRPTPPQLAPVKKARRGIPIFTVVILGGMGTDSAGNSNVTYDLVVRKPDGSIYGDQKNLIGWNRMYQDRSKDLQLAEGFMGIDIEESDPDGTYTVEATVTDRIKNLTLVLRTEFNVNE